MKRAHIGVIAVFVLLLCACNLKSEKKSEPSNENKYFQVEIGTNDNGDFKITDFEAIKEDWESRLAVSGPEKSLDNFKIVQGYTNDDAHKEYYMLIAGSKDSTVRAAALLNLKDGSFYIDTQKDVDGSMFYSTILCEGKCEQGCLPVVTIHDEIRYLNCSPCVECIKKDTEVR